MLHKDTKCPMPVFWNKRPKLESILIQHWEQNILFYQQQCYFGILKYKISIDFMPSDDLSGTNNAVIK